MNLDKQPEGAGILIRIGAIVVSGIAINWVSSTFEPGPVIVLGATLVGLLLLVLADSPRSHFHLPFLGHKNSDLLKFGMSSLLVGAGIGGLWQLPMFTSEAIPLTFLRSAGIDVVDTHNYEIGAIACIIVVGAVAAIRKASISQTFTFGVAAITGNSVVLALLNAHERLLWTVIGWTVCYAFVIGAVWAMPDVLRLFGSFFRIGRGANPQGRGETIETQHGQAPDVRDDKL